MVIPCADGADADIPPVIKQRQFHESYREYVGLELDLQLRLSGVLPTSQSKLVVGSALSATL